MTDALPGPSAKLNVFISYSRDDLEFADQLAIALKATGFGCDTGAWTCPKPLQSVFAALQRGVDWNTTNIDADIVHCHTWYTHFAGVVAKQNYGIPLVVTTPTARPASRSSP